MRIAVQKIGNNSGVILPKPFLNEIGLKTGDKVEIQLEARRIIIIPPLARTRVRAGMNPHA